MIDEPKRKSHDEIHREEREHDDAAIESERRDFGHQPFTTPASKQLWEKAQANLKKLST